MKKILIPAAAILALMAAVSCNDVSINTDTTTKVEVPFEGSTESAEEFVMGEYKPEEGTVAPNQENGQTSVMSPVERTDSHEFTPEENEKFFGGQEVALPEICDMTVKIPISKQFPKDDIFKALDAPYFCITVKNEQGKAFKYSSTLTSKTGKTFTVQAQIPAVKGDVDVIVSEKGNVVAEGLNNKVNASPVEDFPALFEQNPDEIKITDAKVQLIEVNAGNMAQAGLPTNAIEFSAQSVFPFTVKNGVPFTWQWVVDVKESDIKDFLGVKGVEGVLQVTHSLPLDMQLTLAEPEQIKAECDLVPASIDEKPVTCDVNIKATCSAGVSYSCFPNKRAVVYFTATLRGNRATFNIGESSNSNIKIDVKKDEKGKRMVKVTM